MPSVIATLQATIAELRAVNIDLRAVNVDLRAANVRLQERVRDLETRVGQHSGNSSRPPSSDLPGHCAKLTLGATCRMHGLDHFAYLAGVSIACMAGLAAPLLLPAWLHAARDVAGPVTSCAFPSDLSERLGHTQPLPQLLNADAQQMPHHKIGMDNPTGSVTSRWRRSDPDATKLQAYRIQ